MNGGQTSHIAKMATIYKLEIYKQVSLNQGASGIILH